jgi:hypothetical protein
VWEVLDLNSTRAWAAPAPGFVYARSRDGGLTWTKREFLPSQDRGVYDRSFEGTAWRQQPAIGIDGRGQLLLVWREYGSNAIYFQRSPDGETWTAPEAVPGIARGIPRPFDRYDLAADSAGHLHLVAVGYPSGSRTLALLHSEWNGYRWGEPNSIYVASGAPYPEWPRIAVGNGNRLHVVWFGGDSDQVSRTPNGIWYSTAQSSAPAIPSLPRPAPTVAIEGAAQPPEPSGADATRALPPAPDPAPLPSIDSVQVDITQLMALCALIVGLLLLAGARIGRLP